MVDLLFCGILKVGLRTEERWELTNSGLWGGLRSKGLSGMLLSSPPTWCQPHRCVSGCEPQWHLIANAYTAKPTPGTPWPTSTSPVVTWVYHPA